MQFLGLRALGTAETPKQPGAISIETRNDILGRYGRSIPHGRCNLKSEFPGVTPQSITDDLNAEGVTVSLATVLKVIRRGRKAKR